jgi:hypothetical protein
VKSGSAVSEQMIKMWSFIKISLICINGINGLKENFHSIKTEHILNYSLICSWS